MNQQVPEYFFMAFAFLLICGGLAFAGFILVLVKEVIFDRANKKKEE